ncbi:MAG: SDR family NAD(P)-dependent oxidoreductase [Cellvibrionaceae bacterium]|nr:SDR family NAD(P)-dependent oxidoreductase [Cellvibrionaceae bacterium]
MTIDYPQGKTIWLTGASSGIGEALALRLAQMGNYVIVSARRIEPLQALVARYPKCIYALPMDVSESSDLDAFKQQLQAATDCLDMVIMAAGVVEYENDLSFDGALYKRVLDTNFIGAVNTLSVALPLLMKSQQRAHIVGVSSLSVVLGFTRAEAYGASKAALEYFLNALRVDLSPRKFDVTIVRPGFVTTPMTAQNDFPMPFTLSVEEAVDAIIAGVARRKRQFSFPGRLTVLLKLLSWFPGLWYRILGPRMSRNRL